VNYRQRGTKLTIDYQFNLASYGQGALYVAIDPIPRIGDPCSDIGTSPPNIHP